ncbi:MAG: glycosyltransferase family 4 protein [Jaaginema sp. PMC 1079.18]|nr:glycosyltransferase family 4 protein [Jaaginema sp. PMC 1080.18]MEC4852054.1 glycosyltransferase family 4 protein [Jaaginema sp. PMC 1079.18]MEC4868319.1 glycosyltransferase family 4 protein [Jaaginema sp. PMC 1078.18]
MHHALQRRDIELVNLGFPRYPNTLHSQIEKKLRSAVSLFQSPAASIFTESTRYKNFDARVEKQLRDAPCDAVIAPVASSELNFLETNVPIVYVTDATPRLIYDYYHIPETPAEFAIYEQREVIALLKSKLLIYSSNWAANSAMTSYNAPKNKVKVIPFGANIESAPTLKEIEAKFKPSRWRLLFVGVSWERKGGIIAYETLLSLLERGVDAELTIMGCTPPAEIQHERLTVIPFLNKNNPGDRDRFNQMFLQSHFLVFPTRADCSPIATCEANAFGLPVIASNTGGLPTIIKNGKNGYSLPLEARGQEYADAIAQQITDDRTYENLVLSSRHEYDTRLNWDAWATSIQQAISEMLDSL